MICMVVRRFPSQEKAHDRHGDPISDEHVGSGGGGNDQATTTEAGAIMARLVQFLVPTLQRWVYRLIKDASLLLTRFRTRLVKSSRSEAPLRSGTTWGW